MFWDIGLVPLEVNEFGRCKSNIKWLEYGCSATPSICTDTIPYSNTVKHGYNGILTPNKDFGAAISQLVEDPHKRKLIGENAYQTVLSQYDLSKTVELHHKLYRKICPESLLQRLSESLGVR